MKILSENRKANFDYEIFEKFEAGIELFGFEVKSAKQGKFHIVGSYVLPKTNELWLVGAKIDPYQQNNLPKEYDPERNKKLLLHKSEIKYLIGKINQKFMLIPLSVFLKNNFVKILLGLARPRKKQDKRELIKKREFKREAKKYK
jgi:SsrA-binding protein